MAQRRKVVILGAGLQGCGVALELARRGIPSTLVDRNEFPFNESSLRNEGKIHLGLIYAGDKTGRTAQLLLEGALHFGPAIGLWLGNKEPLQLSTPFWYGVANDSIQTADELAEHYEMVEDKYHRLLAENPALNYLGHKPERLARFLEWDGISSRLRSDRFQAVFETAELAIHTESLAMKFREAVRRHPLIEFLGGRVVRSIEESGSGYLIGGDSTEGAWDLTADQVVNATWATRLYFDAQLGMDAPPSLLHRLKYRVIARLPTELCGGPSATMVIGRYGDVVVRPDGTAYLSWYPEVIKGWSHDLAPPAAWDAACRGEVDRTFSEEIAARVISSINDWYPGIDRSETICVDAGVVVALGETDVDDPESGLHDRTRIGVRSVNGYHSVETGKLTTAPMFALEAADCVCRVLGLESPEPLASFLAG